MSKTISEFICLTKINQKKKKHSHTHTFLDAYAYLVAREYAVNLVSFPKNMCRCVRVDERLHILQIVLTLCVSMVLTNQRRLCDYFFLE